MRKPIIITGAGDHARVLLDILLENDFKVLGLTDKNIEKGSLVYGIPVIGDDNSVLEYNPQEITLVNGIGSIKDLNLRSEVYIFFKSKGYTFSSVIHPSAVVSHRAELGEGVQVLAGVVINTDAKIGENSIINTNSTIEHDCHIGKNCHIAPGCTLSGGIFVNDSTHIGTGSSIIQGINIGKNVLVGAGSVVIRDIEDYSKVYGVPARKHE